MGDLLDLLDDLTDAPTVVHAVRPNMWAACGWCCCGCQGSRRDTYELRMNRTDGITCEACLAEMTANPWPNPNQEVAS